MLTLYIPRTRVGANGEDVPHSDLIRLFDEVSKEVADELAVAGRKDDFHGIKVIYSIIRFITCDELEWFLDNCIELKQEFPHIIAGGYYQGAFYYWERLTSETRF